jgi:hypothetical protein
MWLILPLVQNMLRKKKEENMIKIKSMTKMKSMKDMKSIKNVRRMIKR